MIKKINDEELKFIVPTEEASKVWKERLNHLGDLSLLPTTRLAYVGSTLPGKAREQVNYTGGLGMDNQGIRASLPRSEGSRAVKLDEGQKSGRKTTKKVAPKVSMAPEQHNDVPLDVKVKSQPATVAAH